MAVDGEYNTYQFRGKTMVPGTEFVVTGQRGGRFHFLRHAILGEAEWINRIGAITGHHMFRAFRPARISRITKLVQVGKPARARCAGRPAR